MLRLAMRDGDGAVPAIVAIAVGPEGGTGVMVGERAEVVKSRGGLSAFEAVTDILLVLIGGLDVSSDPVLLPVEFGEYLALLSVAVEVGAQSPISEVDGVTVPSTLGLPPLDRRRHQPCGRPDGAG
jgi:hypothetical protein